jgi:predicted SnoaL-like aldol condensation-catalyzing enzyme
MWYWHEGYYSGCSGLYNLSWRAIINSRDPKLTALQFNEYINGQDIEGLGSLMTEGHTFIDREGRVDRGKESMTGGWIEFFEAFPDYRNTFTRVESRDDLVILIGYATWERDSPADHAIWTARIEDDLVAEWRIFHDTEENRKRFGIL